MNNRPLPLPVCDPLSQQIGNRLSTRQETVTVNVGKSGNIYASAGFSLNVYASRPLSPNGHYLRLSVSVGVHTLYLVALSEQCRHWCAATVSSEQWHHLPEELLIAFIKEAGAGLLQWLTQTLCSAVTLFEVTRYPEGKLSEQMTCSQRFTLNMKDKASILPDTEWVVFSDSQSMINKLLQVFPLSVFSETNSLRLWPVPLSLGYSRINITTLSELAIGDILLMQTLPAADKYVVFGWLDYTRLFTAHYEEKNLTLLQLSELSMHSDEQFNDQQLSEFWNDNEDTDTEAEAESTLEMEVTEDEVNLPVVDSKDEDLLHPILPEDIRSEEQIDNEQNSSSEGTNGNSVTTDTHEEFIAGSAQEDLLSIKEATHALATSTNSKAQLTHLGTLPVIICFDVGNITLTLQELQALKPGYTFSLPNEIRHYITLRVHNTIIGRGELVQLNDRLGVEITEMHPTEEQQL